jgi:hypothetical protein
MKIGNIDTDTLTFGELWKLRHPNRIFALLEALDVALRAAWKTTGTKEMFTAGSARHVFPGIAEGFDNEIALLRSPDMDAEMRKAAAKVSPLILTGPGRPIFQTTILDYHTQGYGAEKYARGRAMMVQANCAHKGVPAYVEEKDGAFTVFAQTDEIGAAILSFSPGLPLEEIVRLCWSKGLQPRVYFWWLKPNFEVDHRLDYFGGHLNPATRVANTPDALSHTRARNDYVTQIV